MVLYRISIIKIYYKALMILCFFLSFSNLSAQSDTTIIKDSFSYDYRLFDLETTHSFKQQVLIYSMTLGSTAAFVYPIKHYTNIQRPDKSDYKSFPSGHTAFAFASAETIRREFKNSHPWIGWSAYALATAIGTQRIVYNKHSISDVVIGAGLGMLSSTVSYWIFNKTKRRNRPASKTNIVRKQ